MRFDLGSGRFGSDDRDAAHFDVVDIGRGELRRIRSGPAEVERDERRFLFLVRVPFTANDPEAVISRAGDVLSRVLEHVDDWPAEDAWPELLPSWFVQRCAPERSSDPSWDAKAWLSRWQTMTPEEKAAESAGPWTLSGWLYYFDPDPDEGMGDDRSWWWWDAGTDAADQGWIEVATTGWPFGSGSLNWLIEAGGGVNPDV